MAQDEEFFDLPVFTESQQPPAPVSYEIAVRAFEEIAEALRLYDKPRRIEDIPEFKI